MLVLAFLCAYLTPIVRQFDSDPLSRLLAAQTWCIATADGGPLSFSPDSGDGSQTPAQHPVAKHCPFCAFEHQPFVAMSGAVESPDAPSMREGMPARFDDVPRAQHAWRATLSRAPPFLA